MGSYFGYMRISTQEERGKQKYSRQEKALQRYADTNKIRFVQIFKEDISGASFDNREEWKFLESQLHSGDTIVFKDISRFTREAKNGLAKYMMLMNKGVDLIFLDNQPVSTPYIKQMLSVAKDQNIILQTTLESIVKILLSVELDRVEQERLIISKRTKDGLAASEKTPGRKKGTLVKLTEDLENDIRKYFTDRTITQTYLMKKHKIGSRTTIEKYIRLVKAAGSNSIAVKKPDKKD